MPTIERRRNLRCPTRTDPTLLHTVMNLSYRQPGFILPAFCLGLALVFAGLGREASDQGQVEKLKRLAYEAAANDLVKIYTN